MLSSNSGAAWSLPWEAGPEFMGRWGSLSAETISLQPSTSWAPAKPNLPLLQCEWLGCVQEFSCLVYLLWLRPLSKQSYWGCYFPTGTRRISCGNSKCCAPSRAGPFKARRPSWGSLLKANLLFKINLVFALWGHKGFWSVGFLVFSCCSWWPVSTGVPSNRTLNILLVLHPRSTFSEELKPLQMYWNSVHMLPWLVSHWKIRIDVWGSAHGLDIS